MLWHSFQQSRLAPRIPIILFFANLFFGVDTSQMTPPGGEAVAVDVEEAEAMITQIMNEIGKQIGCLKNCKMQYFYASTILDLLTYFS